MELSAVLSALQPSGWPCQLPCLAERLWQIEALDRRSEALNKRSEALDRRSEALDRRSEALDTRSGALDRRSEAPDRRSEVLDRRSGAPSGPKGVLGSPQGRPKSDQGRPKSTQRGPKGSPEGPRERQNRPQVGLRSEKSQICEKCSATRPCRRSRHFAPPRSTPNRPKIVPSRSLEPVERPPRSTLVARRCLKRRRRATGVDSGRLGRPQGSPRGRLSCAFIR